MTTEASKKDGLGAAWTCAAQPVPHPLTLQSCLLSLSEWPKVQVSFCGHSSSSQISFVATSAAHTTPAHKSYCMMASRKASEELHLQTGLPNLLNVLTLSQEQESTSPLTEPPTLFTLIDRYPICERLCSILPLGGAPKFHTARVTTTSYTSFTSGAGAWTMS